MSSEPALTKDYDEKIDQSSEVGSSQHHASEIPLATPEEERSLVRKLDRRILPITCLLYLFACTPFSH